MTGTFLLPIGFKKEYNEKSAIINHDKEILSIFAISNPEYRKTGTGKHLHGCGPNDCQIKQHQTAMKEIIRQAYDILARGGVILYPTDTVWGLGCDATNSEAVRRIYEIKRRSDAKAMLVLTDAVGRIDYYFDRVPDIAWDLWEVADKPLTLILPRARYLAPELMAEDGSVGIRITNEEVSRNLCAAFKRPIVSTSANISGEPTARTFAEISEEVKQAVDYIVPLRQEETSLPAPSGIIKLGDGGLIQVIR